MRLLLVLVLLLLLTEGQQQFTTRVQTTRGTVRGFRIDQGSNRSALFYGAADIFLGIPFAQPPLGALRFQLPRPICPYQGEVGELAFKPKCAQAASPFSPGGTSSEDCLYLNVFTPSTAVPRAYPVMVWIHGGAFEIGGANEYDYEGAVRNLVSNGVVVVTIQYRLGPFGFFTTYTEEFPPNRGLYDQIMALRWVQQEIAAFGGNPSMVTIFGESAGGVSVSALSLSPLARGLFHRIIPQSGSIQVLFQSPNDVRGAIERDRAARWCNVTADPISSRDARRTLQSCLANITVARLTDAPQPPPGTGVFAISVNWNPVRDGAMFPEDPEVLARMRPRYDALLLDTRDEHALFSAPFFSGNVSAQGPGIIRDTLVRRGYGYLTDEQLDRIVSLITQNYQKGQLAANDNLGWYRVAVEAFSGEQFSRQMRQDANWLKASGSRTYLTTFAYEPRICGPSSATTGYNPIPHFAEICYLWFTAENWRSAANSSRIKPSDIAVANNMGLAWTNFAKTGQTGWPESGPHFAYVSFADTLVVGTDWRGREDRLYNKLLPTLIGNYPPTKVSPIIDSVLKHNGAKILAAWQQSLASCPR
ncbi:hypothetical protein PMAYCL1PPCAC_16087 [Pristionchus mayeri]|uniref:Carboxylic ester hydrolase n=1 Tax=Pristionchus mayeri TaxID=1317129 RepID=A0AAN5CK54_9BILA|nr:hypothetical protein PMAYCL1PPCAC_16087 [Pristionchus mayeri]